MEPLPVRVRIELDHLNIFKGEQLTIYMHNGEHGYSGDRMETVHIAVTEEGEFILQASIEAKELE